MVIKLVAQVSSKLIVPNGSFSQKPELNAGFQQQKSKIMVTWLWDTENRKCKWVEYPKCDHMTAGTIWNPRHKYFFGGEVFAIM